MRRPFALRVHRRRQFDRQRVVDLLGQLRRDESFLAKRAGDLSGGEIQITALLRAVQLDPAVLLLDEPTAALDPDTSLAVEALLGRWVDSGEVPRAMVWVSHNAEQAGRIAPQTMFMEEGRLRASQGDSPIFVERKSGQSPSCSTPGP